MNFGKKEIVWAAHANDDNYKWPGKFTLRAIGDTEEKARAYIRKVYRFGFRAAGELKLVKV